MYDYVTKESCVPKLASATKREKIVKRNNIIKVTYKISLRSQFDDGC